MTNTGILDQRTGNIDILHMAFISPNLTKYDIQFLIGDNFGSNHLPIEISIDAQPYWNIHTNHIRHKFNQTDREVFESTLEAALSSGDVPDLKSTQDIGILASISFWPRLIIESVASVSPARAFNPRIAC